MLTSLWTNWWEDWEYQWKVTFVGETREIIINPGFTEISVKEDIYSAWKQWALLRNNTKFPEALRSTGGDSLGSGLFAGDIYFLRNGWKIVVNELVKIDGVIYHDDGIEVFDVKSGGGVISTVSNLVQTVQVGSTGTGDCPTSEDIAIATENRLNNTLALIDAPISSRASSTEISGGFSTIVSLLSVIDDKINIIDGQITTVGVDLTQMLTIIDALRKFNFNRSKINPNNKTLTIYEDDDITPLIEFLLLDTSENPSTDEVAEKVPRPTTSSTPLNLSPFNEKDLP